MLDLRATYLNGEWNAFWNFHVTRKTNGSTAKYGKLGDANPVVTPNWILTYRYAILGVDGPDHDRRSGLPEPERTRLWHGPGRVR